MRVEKNGVFRSVAGGDMGDGMYVSSISNHIITSPVVVLTPTDTNVQKPMSI